MVDEHVEADANVHTQLRIKTADQPKHDREQSLQPMLRTQLGVIAVQSRLDGHAGRSQGRVIIQSAGRWSHDQLSGV